MNDIKKKEIKKLMERITFNIKTIQNALKIKGTNLEPSMRLSKNGFSKKTYKKAWSFWDLQKLAEIFCCSISDLIEENPDIKKIKDNYKKG